MTKTGLPHPLPRRRVVVLLAAGCSQKYSAERDGKKLGEAVCDLRDADAPGGRPDGLDDINEQLDDLGNKYALFTAEDRADVQNNLADLHEHVIQGNSRTSCSRTSPCSSAASTTSPTTPTRPRVPPGRASSRASGPAPSSPERGRCHAVADAGRRPGFAPRGEASSTEVPVTVRT